MEIQALSRLVFAKLQRKVFRVARGRTAKERETETPGCGAKHGPPLLGPRGGHFNLAGLLWLCFPCDNLVTGGF